MSSFVPIALIGAIALAVTTVAFVALLSLRALRRGAELEAEMKAPSFAFRLHLQPRDGLERSSDGEADSRRTPLAPGDVERRRP